MRNTLAARAVLVTCLVALISVLATAAVAVPVTVTTTNRETRNTVNLEAIVAARQLARRTGAPPADEAATQAVIHGLTARGLRVYLIRAGVPDQPGLPPLVVRQLAAGIPVRPQRASVDGTVALIAGRPLPARGGVVVAAPPVTGTARTVWQRLWLALLVGVAAGLLAGAVLARRLARPFRQAAAAAGKLRAGDRSVRLPPDGPTEAADLARAFNDLAVALQTSEGREREFLLSISHELRTPLTTIKGYAEALADGVIAPDGAPRTGATMLAEAT